ncbi:hypothetical protein NGM07_20005 [Halorussus vallis]|uniref:hypothetical protein n=2 Tax=Halorussus TaxID=1070314 RepID=UPI00209DADCB|nr:hypothetical protein [Halorussus vallis]USZ75645.1 hypothetical protein NGM07_19730 [Halorussus vallis]USZ75699.1 hypothetical protein NGM07_20005 [Halorussus vallis]
MRPDSNAQAFRKLKDDIGENPAQFLDRPLRSDGELPLMIRDRIKGIDRLAVLHAYRAVERKLQRGKDIQNLPDSVDPDALDFYEHDIEPGRQRVLDALDARQQYLEEHGERNLPDWTAEERRERAVKLYEGSGKNERSTEEESLSASQKLARMRSERGEA